MSAFTLAGHRLRPRDEQIIEQIVRHRLTTIDALRQRLFAGVSRNAVAKVVNRLCGLGVLQKQTLLHPTKYYVLSARTTKAWGTGLHREAPLGPQSLPLEFAVLAYATLGQQTRTRLTKHELLSLCPWLPPQLATPPHCYDEHRRVLELVRVDLGGPADHLARKCLSAINERSHLPELARLIGQGRFRLVVITGTQGKARATRQALDRHAWPPGLSIHCSIVPQILSLTASSSHA